jgi:hypothetical protein
MIKHNHWHQISSDDLKIIVHIFDRDYDQKISSSDYLFSLTPFLS